MGEKNILKKIMLGSSIITLSEIFLTGVRKS